MITQTANVGAPKPAAYNFQRYQQKVFCIGLNKTGTTSFGDAMKLLGFRRSGWNKNSHQLTMQFYEGNCDPMFETAYAFDIMEDLPWPLAYAQMDEHFPNAKFVMTMRRSPEVWLESIRHHIRRRGAWVGHSLTYGALSPDIESEGYSRKYVEHNDAVRAHFAGRPGKLLEICFEKGDGWKQICGFLGIAELPNRPFPHSGYVRSKVAA